MAIVRRKSLSNLEDYAPKSKLRELTQQGRDLDYNNTEGTLLTETVNEVLARLDRQDHVHVLDAGAGKGNALKIIEGFAPGSIHAHGIGINSLGPGTQIPKHKWTRGHLESYKFLDEGRKAGAFDVIQGAFVMQHISNIIGYENMLNSLKVGGKMFVQNDGRNKPLSLQTSQTAVAAIKALALQGFEIECKENRNGYLETITRTSKKEADLREFYDCPYLNKVPMKKSIE